jgi:hypothetical protein
MCGNPSPQTVLFRGQVILNDIVQPGDSGSLIVDAATAQPLVLVAGLSSDGQYASADPATDVVKALNAATGSTFSFVGASQHSVACSISSNAEAQSPAERSSLVSTANASSPSYEEVLRAVATQSKHEHDIMQHPAIVGVAVGTNRDDPKHAALLVFVERGSRMPSLPAVLDGFAVQFVPTGRFGIGTIHQDPKKLNCGRRLPRPSS